MKPDAWRWMCPMYCCFDGWGLSEHRPADSGTNGLHEKTETYIDEPLYSAATIRTWLEDESTFAHMWWRTDTGPEAIYRAMIAVKLQEMEGGE